MVFFPETLSTYRGIGIAILHRNVKNSGSTAVPNIGRLLGSSASCGLSLLPRGPGHGPARKETAVVDYLGTRRTQAET